MENSVNEVKEVIETYDSNVVNKLLNTGNCILLGVSNENAGNEDNPMETILLYSIGQVKYGICETCNNNTLKYGAHKHSVWGCCQDGCSGNGPL